MIVLGRIDQRGEEETGGAGSLVQSSRPEGLGLGGSGGGEERSGGDSVGVLGRGEHNSQARFTQATWTVDLPCLCSEAEGLCCCCFMSASRPAVSCSASLVLGLLLGPILSIYFVSQQTGIREYESRAK